ncbi:hypothetical protein COL5a_001957 [Colletotrichum fioriniae]|nr:uncharacterized protein COL516b_001350 [Colletotrichum fioriniae]KAJ0312275.1 hypothetical protein COL516b_001350 [Colletotrichum fioriniae]KAJ0332250.1 hypothetical protein COL5a_001957 [Colletotrichum fioriniae]
MAAIVKAINAKIRSNPVSDYVCSTRTPPALTDHDTPVPAARDSFKMDVGRQANPSRTADFWGPVSNFGIPLAAVMDTQKSPDLISGQMTGALCIYSATFMRYSLAVSPKNYLLFMCHFINEGAQLTQGYRYMQYNYWGGKEASATKDAFETVQKKADAIEAKVETKVKEAVGK